MSFWEFTVDASYFIAAVLFIIGLKRMGSPKTAKSGIKWAGIGMALANRELMQGLRESGEITGGPKPFGKANRSEFLNRLETTVQAARRLK